jgi:hypothetical protein
MIAPLGLALVTAACGQTEEQRAASGGLGGAAAGAVVGGPVGAVVGGAAGAAGGLVRDDAEQAIAERTGSQSQSQAQAQMQAQEPRRSQQQAGAQASPQDIRAAQEKLQAMGLYEGQVDGLSGPLTMRAVSRYQEMQGMPQTATLDDRTLESLEQQTATRPQGAEAPRQQQLETQQERQQQQRDLQEQEQDRQRQMQLQRDPLPPRTAQ